MWQSLRNLHLCGGGWNLQEEINRQIHLFNHLQRILQMFLDIQDPARPGLENLYASNDEECRRK